jgi:hypothetical protein
MRAVMTKLERRRRSQRGSVLSGLLIIVAFLSILGSALMSEISSQFLMTRNVVDQVRAQATVEAGMENAIAQLQDRVVPFRCSTDQPSPIGPITVNQQWAAANQISCRQIVPDVARGLQGGAFTIDGTHISIGAHNVYLVADQSGNLYSYRFGQTGPLWQRSLGSTVTGPPNEMAYGGHYLEATPTGSSVSLVNDFGTSASVICSMPASAPVRSRAGFGAGTAFPSYTFFGDDAGVMHVYDPGCAAPTPGSAALGGRAVSGPLVLPGTVTTNQSNGPCLGNGGGGEQLITTTTAQVFVLVSNSSGSALVDLTFAEDSTGSNTQACWFTNNRQSLSFGNATGLSFYTNGGTHVAAISFGGGQLQLASITAVSAHGQSSGFTYSMSRGQSVSPGGSFSHAPSWSPDGSEVGAGNGQSLFVFDSGLKQVFRYDGQATVDTSPAADIHGDWYFGADDGYVYDVEPPAPGAAEMFKAARVGLGGQVQSSPVVGSPADGCAGNVCLYFGDASKGSYFVQIGNIRVMQLRSCMASSTSSTSCVTISANNPSLWARLEVGDPTYMQGRSVNVIGWAYSNGP